MINLESIWFQGDEIKIFQIPSVYTIFWSPLGDFANNLELWMTGIHFEVVNFMVNIVVCSSFSFTSTFNMRIQLLPPNWQKTRSVTIIGDKANNSNEFCNYNPIKANLVYALAMTVKSQSRVRPLNEKWSPFKLLLTLSTHTWHISIDHRSPPGDWCNSAQGGSLLIPRKHWQWQ